MGDVEDGRAREGSAVGPGGCGHGDDHVLPYGDLAAQVETGIDANDFHLVDQLAVQVVLEKGHGFADGCGQLVFALLFLLFPADSGLDETPTASHWEVWRGLDGGEEDVGDGVFLADGAAGYSDVGVGVGVAAGRIPRDLVAAVGDVAGQTGRFFGAAGFLLLLFLLFPFFLFLFVFIPSGHRAGDADFFGDGR
jgi:hypothetical protein